MRSSTYAIFSFPHMCRIPYDVKDPSATLGMTIRENGLSHISFHLTTRTNLRPFGAPPSRGRREKVENEGTVFPPIPLPSPRGEDGERNEPDRVLAG